jgi:hypothetical protein
MQRRTVMSAQTHQPRVLAGRLVDVADARRALRERDGHGPAGRQGARSDRDAVHETRLRRWRDRAALRR